MTITANKALFDYWFVLQSKAAEKDWNRVRHMLNMHVDDPLPRHNLNDLTFKAAIDKEHLDIVEIFFERGYVPAEDVFTNLLRKLTGPMRGESLSQEDLERVQRWFDALSPQSRVAALDHVLSDILKSKNETDFERIFPVLASVTCNGFDPWRGGALLNDVVQEGSPKKLIVMLKSGLDPYAVDVMLVFAALGADKNATATQRAQIGIWMNFCWRHPATDPAMADFERLKSRPGQWYAADFLSPLTRQPSPCLIDVIAVRGGHKELKEVFDQTRWQGRFAEMQQVYDAAMTRTSLAPADMAVVRAQFAQASLRERTRPRVSFSGPKGNKP